MTIRTRARAVKAVQAEPEKELSSKLLKTVGAEHLQDIFSDSVKDLLKKDIESKKIVEKKELELFLFKESQLQARTAFKSGKKCCRYSPVMLRWCMDLLGKLGHGCYTFLSKVCHFPSASRLKQFSGHDCARKDGSMYESCRIFQEGFQEHYRKQEEKGNIDASWSNRNSELGKYLQTGSIGFDSLLIKAGIVFDCHSLKIVGFADERQNSPDAIIAALDSAVKQVEEAEEIEEGNNNNKENTTDKDNNTTSTNNKNNCNNES